MARKNRSKKESRFTREGADRYELYEGSVYDPDADHDFLVRVYRSTRKRRPILLREDFAGTSKLSALWVDNHRETKAWAVDFDPEPLEWGRKKHVEPLGEKAQRLTQIEDDVLKVETPKVDVLTAFNFSYWIFEERAMMLDYFKKVYEALDKEGMFVVDLMGGPGVQQECEEPRGEDGGFTYIWEQEVMDAITGHIDCHIHFEFEDGTEYRNAFDYSWRVWSITELRDIMLEAGFEITQTYWEGADKDGEGNGVFKKKTHAENEETWIAYLVAWKTKP